MLRSSPAGMLVPLYTKGRDVHDDLGRKPRLCLEMRPNNLRAKRRNCIHKSDNPGGILLEMPHRSYQSSNSAPSTQTHSTIDRNHTAISRRTDRRRDLRVFDGNQSARHNACTYSKKTVYCLCSSYGYMEAKNRPRAIYRPKVAIAVARRSPFSF